MKVMRERKVITRKVKVIKAVVQPKPVQRELSTESKSYERCKLWQRVQVVKGKFESQGCLKAIVQPGAVI